MRLQIRLIHEDRIGNTLAYFLQDSEPTIEQVQLHLAGSGP
jgi:hypothetical protein